MDDQLAFSTDEDPTGESPLNAGQPQVRSLRELIDLVTGRTLKSDLPQEDAGLAEPLPFPFLALVGQMDMKLALLLALINPAVGGVLLIGPRGTGKTTAVRSLLNLLPDVDRSACFYGCLPEDIESGGIDAVCPDCARKYGEGIPLTVVEPARLVELPLNARLEDVIGGLDERALVHERTRLKRGILAHADKNILYLDEANLFGDDIIDSILDASAQGSYTIRRGPVALTYRSRFTLIGTMNPEEGSLRPQILDRFGLRVMVRGLEAPDERLEAYQRTRSYLTSPRRFIDLYGPETSLARSEIEQARRLLPSVRLPQEVTQAGLDLTRGLEIDSLRAEITLFEAARAYAAADSRNCVDLDDLKRVAHLALRQRRSQFMVDYFKERASEDKLLDEKLNQIGPK